MDSNSLTSSLFRAKGRKINEDEETFELREESYEYQYVSVVRPGYLLVI